MLLPPLSWRGFRHRSRTPSLSWSWRCLSCRSLSRSWSCRLRCSAAAGCEICCCRPQRSCSSAVAARFRPMARRPPSCSCDPSSCQARLQKERRKKLCTNNAWGLYFSNIASSVKSTFFLSWKKHFSISVLLIYGKKKGGKK